MPDTGMQFILVCRAAPGEGFVPISPVDSAGIPVALCPGGTHLYAGQQQLIEVAFDYSYASGVWSLAFTTVVAFYFVSHGISLILQMIRRG